MAQNMEVWDDCVDVEDMEAMWNHPEVHQEWLRAGKERGMKVHMSSNIDGKPYVTHTEMKGMAEIITRRYFQRLDVGMICAIAEMGSSRHPLAHRFEPKLNEASTGLMQTLQSTAEWLATDMGYRAYAIENVSALLYRPFESVYFGAAYLNWLSTYEGKERNEEFMVRAFYGGPRDAFKPRTIAYWSKYLQAKQSLPNISETPLVTPVPLSAPPRPSTNTQKIEWTYWDEKVSPEDLDEIWRHPQVKKEWTSSNENRGQVRFARDAERRPYLTTTELKAVAEIIVSRYFADRVSPIMLRTIAEVSSKRLLHGADGVSGLMQTAYPTAAWLFKDMGYKAYKLRSREDLSNPFLAMYFGAAYVCWLTNYSGRPRTDEFVLRAYFAGPSGWEKPSAGIYYQKYLAHRQASPPELQKSASTGGQRTTNALLRGPDPAFQAPPNQSIWKRLWA